MLAVAPAATQRPAFGSTRLIESEPCSDFELDAWSLEDMPPVLSADRVDALAEEILTNVWLGWQYAERGAEDLARECAAAAFGEWRAYFDVLLADLRAQVVGLALRAGIPGAAPCLLLGN